MPLLNHLQSSCLSTRIAVICMPCRPPAATAVRADLADAVSAGAYSQEPLRIHWSAAPDCPVGLYQVKRFQASGFSDAVLVVFSFPQQPAWRLLQLPPGMPLLLLYRGLSMWLKQALGGQWAL